MLHPPSGALQLARVSLLSGGGGVQGTRGPEEGEYLGQAGYDQTRRAVTVALRTSAAGHLSLVYVREGRGEIVILRRMCKRELSLPPPLRHTLGPNPATTWAWPRSPHHSQVLVSIYLLLFPVPHPPCTYLPAFPPTLLLSTYHPAIYPSAE